MGRSVPSNSTTLHCTTFLLLGNLWFFICDEVWPLTLRALRRDRNLSMMSLRPPCSVAMADHRPVFCLSDQGTFSFLLNYLPFLIYKFHYQHNILILITVFTFPTDTSTVHCESSPHVVATCRSRTPLWSAHSLSRSLCDNANRRQTDRSSTTITTGQLLSDETAPIQRRYVLRSSRLRRLSNYNDEPPNPHLNLRPLAGTSSPRNNGRTLAPDRQTTGRRMSSDYKICLFSLHFSYLERNWYIHWDLEENCKRLWEV